MTVTPATGDRIRLTDVFDDARGRGQWPGGRSAPVPHLFRWPARRRSGRPAARHEATDDDVTTNDAMIVRRGAVIGVVSPGFAVQAARLRAGVRALERMGFDVRLGEHALERRGYFAGDDEARRSDLLRMLVDPAIDAVWFSRGGYGTARLLDAVPWRRLRTRPKPLIGYSDLTALFCPAIRRAGCRCLYGPVVTELGERRAFHAGSLARALAGQPQTVRIARRHVLARGRVTGPLVGGNLSVLVHLLGTPWAPDLRGAILFVEDAGEATYRIDRMLTQLGQSGTLREVAGVVVGSLVVPARRRFPPDRALRDVLEESLGRLGVPAVVGVVAGHVAGKLTLPLGGRATLDSQRGTLLLDP